MVSNAFEIRPATIDDVSCVAHHRAAMFKEMGVLRANLVDDMVSCTRTFLQRAIVTGEYIGWLAGPIGDQGVVAAGAGVQVRKTLPFPRLLPDGRADVAVGRQAIVLNVYTEPGFRRLGLARALMYEVLGWARATHVESLVLHAAPDGRPLYEALGFAVTNEMRFTGDLASWQRPVD